jgi:hypothetical protein
MTLYALVLFAHVLAAAVLVGSSLSAPALHGAIRRAATVAELRPWTRFARDAARLNPASAVVLLATGIYLASGRWTEGWIQVGLALFVVNSALAVRVVKGTLARLGLAAASGEGAVTESLDALRRSVALEVATHLLIANDVAALYLMVAQPGLAASLAVTVVAAAAAIALAWRHRPSARGASAAPAEDLRVPHAT